MPGPKYVTDFTFPSDFGFTGSASDRSTVTVRPHERSKPQRFARGGKVRKAEGGLVDRLKSILGSQYTQKEADAVRDKELAQAPPPQNPPKKDTIQVNPQGSTVDTLKNQRERQMKELGLKKGGRVRHKDKGRTKLYHGAAFPAGDFDSDGDSDGDSDADGMKRGGKVKVKFGRNTDLAVPSKSDPDDVTAPMARRGGAIRKAKDGKWIAGAIKHPGAFSAKAKKAGMSTAKYAAKVTKEGSKASAQTKRQGNLAKTLASFHHAKGGRIGRYAMGGPVKAKGGGKVNSDAAEDRPMMKKIAKEAVAEHVNYPAPKGHKGLRSC
jgi:hypothetical protein